MDSPRQPDGPAVRDGKPYSRIAHLAEDVRPFVAVGRALRAAGLSAPDDPGRGSRRRFPAARRSRRPRVRPRGRRRTAPGDAVAAALDVLVRFRSRCCRARCRCRRRRSVAPACHRCPISTPPSSASRPSCCRTGTGARFTAPTCRPPSRAEFDALWQPVIAMLLAAPKGWVLRDYTRRTCCGCPSGPAIARVGVIDFQDAIAGPWAHDLVSLLQDARVDVRARARRSTARPLLCRDGAASRDFDEGEFRARLCGLRRAAQDHDCSGSSCGCCGATASRAICAICHASGGISSANLRHPALRAAGAGTIATCHAGYPNACHRAVNESGIGGGHEAASHERAERSRWRRDGVRLRRWCWRQDSASACGR